jgi:hypothetical protein
MVLDLAPNYWLGVGPVSSKWWGDGGRKKGEDKHTDFLPPAGPLPWFCPESAVNCHGRDFLGSPGSGNFPQSPAKLCSPSVRFKIGAGLRNGASLNVRSEATRGDF